MSFITNITGTPVTGSYNQNGAPSGINNTATTTSKFSSTISPTNNLVSSSHASGISDAN